MRTIALATASCLMTAAACSLEVAISWRDAGPGANGDGAWDVDTGLVRVRPVEGCTSVEYQEHRYVFCYVPMTADGARADCQARGMHLISIEDAGENGFVFGQAMRSNSGEDGLLLGATDATVEDQWVWDDGTPFSFTNWSPDEPSRLNPGENCLVMLLSYNQSTWDDRDCSAVTLFGCEGP